jgi:anaerobic selenocysteine-containing dehydrogenase
MSNHPKSSIDNRRRTFLKAAALATAATPLAGQLVGLKKARAQANLTMLSPDDPMAKSLKYTEDAAKAEGRQGDAHCGTCQLYTKVGEKDGKEVGTCTLFLNPTVRHVYNQAWCSAWVKKPS